MASQPIGTDHEGLPKVDIKPLLAKLWPNDGAATPKDVADAISHFFTNQVTEAQTAALLMALHFTKMDFRADVLAEAAYVMRQAAAAIPVEELKGLMEKRGRKEGNYRGGLVRTIALIAHEKSTNICLLMFSVILLAPGVTHTTLSISVPLHQFSHRPC